MVQGYGREMDTWVAMPTGGTERGDVDVGSRLGVPLLTIERLRILEPEDRATESEAGMGRVSTEEGGAGEKLLSVNMVNVARFSNVQDVVSAPSSS